MTKILVILLWPAGLALIAGTGALLARRPGSAALASGPWSRPRGRRGRQPDSLPASQRLAVGLLALVVGLVVVYAATALVGLLIVHGGPAIDKPIFRWLAVNRVHWWKDTMFVTTQLGLKWTTWSAAAAAGLGLALLWRENRWLPPAILFALIIIDHYLIRALTVTFHRVPPPGSGGTFPSGGCDRVIVIYGLIAYLLWRERSGRRTTAVWAATVVAALGFNEAYSRTYLGLHWFTDTLGGLFCGSLELAAFVLAVRVITGPAPRTRADGPGTAVLAEPGRQRPPVPPAPGRLGRVPWIHAVASGAVKGDGEAGGGPQGEGEANSSAIRDPGLPAKRGRVLPGWGVDPGSGTAARRPSGGRAAGRRSAGHAPTRPPGESRR